MKQLSGKQAIISFNWLTAHRKYWLLFLQFQVGLPSLGRGGGGGAWGALGGFRPKHFPYPGSKGQTYTVDLKNFNIHIERDAVVLWISYTSRVTPSMIYQDSQSMRQWTESWNATQNGFFFFFRWVDTTRLLVKYSIPFLNLSVNSPFFPTPCSSDTKMKSGGYWVPRWPKIEDLYAVGLFQCERTADPSHGPRLLLS